MATIGLIVPTYGQWGYVLKTVQSFFANTPGNLRCYVLDDNSPDWDSVDWTHWPKHVKSPHGLDKAQLVQATPKDLDSNAKGDERILVHRFNGHSGLTRSWNMGLRLGGKSDYWSADYVIAGNSDILFTPGWHTNLINALKEYELVGPITNASGRVFQQNITKFLRNYKLTDDPNYLNEVAKRLQSKYVDKVYRTWRINGFFMMAKKEIWWSGAFDEDHIIDPAEKMDNGAYELQKRWRQMGRKIGLVPSSFIWHYRSVSRGPKGLRGDCGKGAFRPKVRHV